MSDFSRAIVSLEPQYRLGGRYVIDQWIDDGPLFSQYDAFDESSEHLRRTLRVVPLPRDEPSRASTLSEFLDAGRKCVSFDHPHILPVSDAFVEGDLLVTVTRHAPFGSLEQLLGGSGESIDEARVTRWGAQISRALAYLHKQKEPVDYLRADFAHMRVLAPASILLDDAAGERVLLDCGFLPCVASAPGEMAFGATGYVPRECFGKARAHGPRSDLYSLGATLFQLLTSEDPQDNPLLIFDFARNPKPSQINASITPAMEALLMRLVASDPQNRPESANAVAEELEEHGRRLAAGGHG